MLSYRHQFHAGGPADVLKHSILTILILEMKKKDKPFFVLDTHGGAGLYDLKHPWAEKTNEWRDGIGRIWDATDIPESLDPYLTTIRAFNRQELRWYPGSPTIIQQNLRSQDRLSVAELNKGDLEHLKARFHKVPKTEVIAGDGFHAVKAKLPPVERRGLVFMDASFDQPNEFQRILGAVRNALKRFRTGTIAVWRPILDDAAMQDFDSGFVELLPPQTIKLGLELHSVHQPGRAKGSDLVIINPPFRLTEKTDPMLEWLWSKLAQTGEGGPIHKVLVKE